jgi:hypothetical protein
MCVTPPLMAEEREREVDLDNKNFSPNPHSKCQFDFHINFALWRLFSARYLLNADTHTHGCGGFNDISFTLKFQITNQYSM